MAVFVKCTKIAGAGASVSGTVSATAHNTLLALCSEESTTNQTLTVSGGGTWVTDDRKNDANNSVAFASCLNATGGSATTTSTFGGGTFNLTFIFEFSGLAAASAFESAGTLKSGTSSGFGTNALTNVQAAGVFVAAVHINDQSTGTVASNGTGWTLPTNGNDPGSGTTDAGGTGYKVVSAVASQTETWTFAGVAINYTGGIAFYKDAAAASFYPPMRIRALARAPSRRVGQVWSPPLGGGTPVPLHPQDSSQAHARKPSLRPRRQAPLWYPPIVQTPVLSPASVTRASARAPYSTRARGKLWLPSQATTQPAMPVRFILPERRQLLKRRGTALWFVPPATPVAPSFTSAIMFPMRRSPPYRRVGRLWITSPFVAPSTPVPPISIRTSLRQPPFRRVGRLWVPVPGVDTPAIMTQEFRRTLLKPSRRYGPLAVFQVPPPVIPYFPLIVHERVVPLFYRYRRREWAVVPIPPTPPPPSSCPIVLLIGGRIAIRIGPSTPVGVYEWI